MSAVGNLLSFFSFSFFFSFFYFAKTSGALHGGRDKDGDEPGARWQPAI